MCSRQKAGDTLTKGGHQRRRQVAGCYDGLPRYPGQLKLGLLFDGSERLIGVTSVPWYTRQTICRSCSLLKAVDKTAISSSPVTGREANEIFATATAAGIASEGAAGSSIEGVSKLRC